MDVIAKQQVSQRYIFKINSARLRNSKWDLTLSLAEARKNNEIISLADSQVLRWLDELNGITGAEEKVQEIRAAIRRIRNGPNDPHGWRIVKKLYAELDSIQFKPDYVCLIIDREKDYRRACKGFKINGVKYHRLLGTNGGVKNSTIVFIGDKFGDEIRRRIENDRNVEVPLVPAKLEAYKALTCSASTPVSYPNGVLVVDDCETEFFSDIVYLSDEAEGEPVMEPKAHELIKLDESDGYGMMLPSLAERWSQELGLDYITCGFNTRLSWEKGMVFTFDFVDFAEKVVGQYFVKDAWGNQVDIHQVELILTTSMLKLWDSYDSIDHYLECCRRNHYTFCVTKVCPEQLENERTLNYQFIQPFDLSDDDVEELIAPTVQKINDVLSNDPAKTVLYLCGIGLSDDNIERIDNDIAKAIMVDPDMLNDPYIQSHIYNMIKGRIKRAARGVLSVHGNYSIIGGDPYALCQHMFGLPVSGLLKAGEVWNKYWLESGSESLVCFRAPMTTHSNIRKVHPAGGDKTRYWFRYLTACTMLNAWDTACAALNGADKDGDLVMLTDNKVLVERMRELPALMCIQRKAEKKIVTEEDLITANINSFGSEIGVTTNYITSMYEVRSHYDVDSIEYRTLSYRIDSGQQYQQNAIDKTKGIICKPMPKSWYDWHAVNEIEDEEQRDLYKRIIADKKPYFMRHVYPSLMAEYNKYIKTANKNSIREYRISLDELLAIPEDELSDGQREFIRFYNMTLPVGTGPCVMNRICWRIEEEFDHYLTKHNTSAEFDYTIMKRGIQYPEAKKKLIKEIYDRYNKSARSYKVYAARERIDEDEMAARIKEIKEDLIRQCTMAVQDRFMLCDIVLDLCYLKSTTKSFAWYVSGAEIVENLLARHDNMISYPVADPDGDIVFNGRTFIMHRNQIGATEFDDLFG